MKPQPNNDEISQLRADLQDAHEKWAETFAQLSKANAENAKLWKYTNQWLTHINNEDSHYDDHLEIMGMLSRK